MGVLRDGFYSGVVAAFLLLMLLSATGAVAT